jgi:uncharacterized protein
MKRTKDGKPISGKAYLVVTIPLYIRWDQPEVAPVTAQEAIYRLGEFRAFEGGGKKFLYLVPSAGIFELDPAAESVLKRLTQGGASYEELCALASEDVIEELYQAHAIAGDGGFAEPLQQPQADFPVTDAGDESHQPVQSLLPVLLRVRRGQSRDARRQAEVHGLRNGKASVDYLFATSGGRRAIHITFFGGETLMNFPLLKQIVDYASGLAAERGRYIDFSLTTNATLLTPTIIEYLSEKRIGVTVSMDGGKEAHDKFRVFANGKRQLRHHRAACARVDPRPQDRGRITARVTMTSQAMDVMGTYRHLKDELGFWEVGFRARDDRAESPVFDQ